MRIVLSLIFSAVFFIHSVKAQKVISGVISDKITGEKLSYATVVLKYELTGTSSNINGEFEILISGEKKNDSLIVSFLGYHNFEIGINEVKDRLLIKMEPRDFRLNEFVVRPLPPTYYIKQAVLRARENYPSTPFQTQSYYREEVLENNKFIKDTEAIFKTYYPSYQDTFPNQHQLILHRAGDTYSVQFMQDKIEKKMAKKEKEAKKKGEALKEREKAGMIINLGGPETILEMDFIKHKESFLDSTQFKKYNYTFGGVSSYQEKELLIIDFQSRKVVEHERQKGKIYIDPDSYAIVSIEYSSDFVIPLTVRPLIYLMGYEIINPAMKKKFKFYEHNGKWYPKDFQWTVNVEMVKKHIFKKNEHSVFIIEQVLFINKINNGKIFPIDKEKRFKASEKFEDQIYNDSNASWSEVNAVRKPQK